GADHRTLQVRGKTHLRVYQATIDEGDHVRHSSGQRHFCGKCGSALWLYDPTWPDLVHPHASAIDTPLPRPPAHVHIMLDSKAPWVRVEGRKDDQRFDHYPDFSLKEWHERQGLSGGIEAPSAETGGMPVAARKRVKPSGKAEPAGKDKDKDKTKGKGKGKKSAGKSAEEAAAKPTKPAKK
ncbi:MAG: alanine acetyltransferase, partial [Rhodoferax sp.]|nr:alanine acetyltransferase [Rhodoferax sp.]